MIKHSLNLLTAIILLSNHSSIAQIYLPVKTPDRQSISIELTGIGEFGLWRKARPNVPGHIHTGIDIKRPVNNYVHEPILPIAVGRVISKRTDGPFAQLIIEHRIDDNTFWTLYEHISGITVELNELVNPNEPIARFMNRKELDKYGWQFDHFHFEVLQRPPVRIKPDSKHPSRRFGSFTLTCFTQEQLEQRFYDPLDFFKNNF